MQYSGIFHICDLANPISHRIGMRGVFEYKQGWWYSMRSHWVWLISPFNHHTISPKHHCTIATFHHSKYTCYRAVWLRAMLIVLNEFGISTYVLIDKMWIGGSHDLRTNNTLITSIYLCCIDTWKTTVYVYPRLLLLCLCVPVSVDLSICCIKKIVSQKLALCYQTQQ